MAPTSHAWASACPASVDPCRSRRMNDPARPTVAVQGGRHSSPLFAVAAVLSSSNEVAWVSLKHGPSHAVSVRHHQRGSDHAIRFGGGRSVRSLNSPSGAFAPRITARSITEQSISDQRRMVAVRVACRGLARRGSLRSSVRVSRNVATHSEAPQPIHGLDGARFMRSKSSSPSRRKCSWDESESPERHADSGADNQPGHRLAIRRCPSPGTLQRAQSLEMSAAEEEDGCAFWEIPTTTELLGASRSLTVDTTAPSRGPRAPHFIPLVHAPELQSPVETLSDSQDVIPRYSSVLSQLADTDDSQVLALQLREFVRPPRSREVPMEECGDSSPLSESFEDESRSPTFPVHRLSSNRARSLGSSHPCRARSTRSPERVSTEQHPTVLRTCSTERVPSEHQCGAHRATTLELPGVDQEIMPRAASLELSCLASRAFARGRAPTSTPRAARAMVEFSAILCLGDSLTAGYIDGVAAAVPYTDRLAERLEASGANVLVTNAGVPGELSSQMSKRLLSQLQHGPRYDIVLILAGTNDILHKHPPDQTVATVTRLHQLAWDAGVRTAVMSIPPVCLAGSTQLALLEEYRRMINRRLEQLAVMHRQRTVFIDVAALVPLSSSALWSSDGLHLTRAGYETIGGFIADL